MKLKKLNTFHTKLPTKGAFTIDTEFNFPKLHTLMCVSGKRGGGKSVAISNFCRLCKDKGYYDRVYLITPTYMSNKNIWDIASIEEQDVFEPDMNVIKTLIKKVETEKEEYDEYLERKAKYKKFIKDMKYKNIHSIDVNDMLYYYDFGFIDGKKPEWKYKDDSHPPRLAVIIDDAVGTDLMSKRTAGLLNLCIKHRHIADGLGISIFMLVQSYCCQGGVARPIRENCTHLLLFKINDENQIKKVKEESDLPITDEEFMEMCNYAHSIPFNFLFLDFALKCKKRMFRSGFDDIIIPKSLENVSCDCEKCIR